MKAKRVISALVAALFFFTWSMPAALAEEAGDELVEIFKVDVKPPVDLLPEGVEIVEGFEPGQGTPIGTIKKVRGSVVTIHKQTQVAYPIKEELPLFAGDMLISGEGSSIQAMMNDQTVFSLAPYSKMVLDTFIYDPDKASRNSLVNLLFGKARFIASKLTGGRDGDFSVTTPTANLGVRGSDFALSVVPVDALSASRLNWLERISLIREVHAQEMGVDLSTTVVTGEETTVGFAGTVGPEQTVTEFSASRAVSGMEAIVPLSVTAAVAIGALTAAGPGLAALFGAGAGAGAAAGAGIGTGTIAAAGAAAALGVAAISGGGGGGGGAPATPTTTTPTTTTPTTTTTTPTTTSSSTTSTTATTLPVAVFPGSISGSWSGYCVHHGYSYPESGEFSVTIDANGIVSGTFWGSDSGPISGSVTCAGDFSAMAGYSGECSWRGNLTRANGSLSASGSYFCFLGEESCSGGWSGTEGTTP
jgi:hypothetical protein